MPITAAKGQINICLEPLANQGMQNLLNNVAAAATMSATNQPVSTATQGVRLVVWVENVPTSGSTPTISIAGLNPAGGSVTEGPFNVALSNPAAQNSVVGKFEYESVNIFESINASGITTTNLAGTGATITIWAVQAGKFMVPGTLKVKKKIDKFSPNEHRNLLDKDTKRMQTLNKVTIEEFSQVLYPENSLWIAYMLTGSVPTVTTLPASPTSLHASVAVGTISLTTQPTAPGMVLIFVITGSSATGSFTIAGTNQYGVAVNETVVTNGNGTNANGTYYSANVYSAVNASGIVFTGDTSGSVTITGVFGWQYVFLPGDTVYSACFEMFTGVDSFSCPWTMISEADIEYGMDKELKLTAKGIAQDRIVIGSRTGTFLNTNQITALGQPTDMPMVGWPSLVYFDTSVASIGTNSFGDLLEGKFTFKSPQTGGWTSTNSQNYNRVNRGKRETSFSGKIDLTNVLQLEQHRMNLLQYLTFKFQGQPIGGGNNKMWQWTFPARWDDFDEDSEPTKERVEVSVMATAEYDSGLGGAYQLTIVDQQPPTYPN